MKLFSGILAFIFAFAISGVSGFFSIFGLTALFSSVFYPIVVMGTVLESGKIMTAGWLHANWHNKNVSILMKGYLVCAVLALMLITSIGIYGFLAKGYLEQQLPLGTISIQIAQKEQRIATDKENIQRLNDRQKQLDAAVNSLIVQNQVVRSQTIRTQQKKEREQIASDLNDYQKDIENFTNDLIPLKLSNNDKESKLGPIRYVAELFGWTNPDIAVRMVILIIMFAFDPLAIVLVLSGSISIGEWLQERKSVTSISLPIKSKNPVIKTLDTNLGVQVMPLTGETDKATVLEILQRNPDYIEEIIDTVIEFHEKYQSNI